MNDDQIEPGTKLPLRYESAIIIGTISVIGFVVIFVLELLSRIFDWTWQ